MKKFLLFNVTLLVLLICFSNKSMAQLTPVANTNLTAIGRGTVSAADFDNDGILDLIVVGQTGDYLSLTTGVVNVYKGNGDGTFTDKSGQWFSTAPTGVGGGILAAADYDNDGYIDFCYAGFANTVLITKLYHNNGGAGFTDVTNTAFASTTAPVGVYSCSIQWGDVDNDGDLDLIIQGRTYTDLAWYGGGSAQRVNSTQLYVNNGNGTFTIAPTIPGTNVSYGQSLFADLDNDGDLDIIYSGGGNIGGTYKNDGTGIFNSAGSYSLGTTRGSNMVIADFNKDGKLDVLQSWSSTSTGNAPNLRIGYNTNTPTAWSNYSVAVPPGVVGVGNVGSTSNIGMLSCIDYDNDGDLDYTIQGLTAATTPSTTLYLNDGAATPTFTAATGISLTGLHYGGALWGDFNNDGKPDLLTFGYSDLAATTPAILVYKNETPAANVAPQAASAITATPQLSNVTLSWTMPSNADDMTPNASLTYNIFLRNAAGKYIVCPMADTVTGVRRIGGSGSLTTAFYNLKALPAGTYRWGVQAIDGSGNGGVWAIGSFQINTTTQTSNIIASNITSAGMTLSWTNGDQANRAVFMKAAFDVMPMIPDSLFTANAAFGTSTTRFRRSGWFCVYIGSGSTVDITGLTVNTIYTVAVMEYSGTGPVIFNLSKATNNPLVTSTYPAPTAQASSLSISGVTSSQMDLSWTIGDGTSRAVFVKAANSGTPAPVNGKTYTANTVLGSSSQIGSSGWYCVFNGTGTGVTVTGLSEKTDYSVMVCEYTGVTGVQNYLSTTATGNPAITQTISSITTQASTLAVVPGSSQFDVTWTSGSGSKRVVFMTQGNSGAPSVLDNQTYTANTAFGQGTSDGNNWYCVYNGTGNSVSVTGLSLNTVYRVVVYEYNGAAGAEKYLLTNAEFLNQSTISKLAQVISFAALTDKLVTDVPFDLTATGGASGNPVIFASSDPAIATISGNTVTIVAAGTVNITASQLGDATYADATPVTKQLAIKKLTQAITFGSLTAKLITDAPFVITATGGASGNAVTFDSSDPLVATISGSTVTITGAGTATITASQTGNAIYGDAPSVPQTLTVTKVPQTIAFGALTPVYFGIVSTFNLTATGGASGNQVTFASSNTGAATVSGNTVTIVGPGTTNITASQTGNSNYADATPVIQGLTVYKKSQNLIFDAPATKTFGNVPFDLVATAGETGNPVTFTSSNTAVATITGATVTILTAGSTTITATQLGNATYNDAVIARTLTVNKASQTITFDILPVMTTLDAPFTLVATSSSGLPVTFTSSNTRVASVTGNTVTIKSAGNTDITAACATNTNYLVATSIIRSLMVNKVSQTITFDALLAKTITDANFKLTATASSGKTVNYTSSDPTVAKIVSGDSVYIMGKGLTYITATQPGDTIYLAAMPVQQLLAVDWTLGIRSVRGNDITIYPNPASDKIYVSFADAPVNASISMYNTSGRLVSTTKVEGKVTEVGLTKLAPGVYIVKLITPDGVNIKQIVKQ